MAQDFRNYTNVGVAVNSGPSLEKAQLIELLDQAIALSNKLGLYVRGEAFELSLKGVTGALQRSQDTREPLA